MFLLGTKTADTGYVFQLLTAESRNKYLTINRQICAPFGTAAL
jgi:hypothetical protein